MKDDKAFQLPAGWSVLVELDGITFEDLAKIAKMAEDMGMIHSTVVFSYNDDGQATHITLGQDA